MSRFRRAVGAAVVAVVIATSVGCGGDEDDPVVESPSPTAGSGGGQPAGSSGYDYPG